LSVGWRRTKRFPTDCGGASGRAMNDGAGIGADAGRMHLLTRFAPTPGVVAIRAADASDLEKPAKTWALRTARGETDSVARCLLRCPSVGRRWTPCWPRRVIVQAKLPGVRPLDAGTPSIPNPYACFETSFHFQTNELVPTALVHVRDEADLLSNRPGFSLMLHLSASSWRRRNSHACCPSNIQRPGQIL